MWLAVLALLGFGVLAVGAENAAAAPPAGTPPDPWTRFDDLFKKYGALYNVKWTWLKAIALNESNLGREKSVARGLASPSDIAGSTSSDGKSWGLMQVTVTTGRGLDPLCTPEKLNNAEYSINLSAKYIAQLQKKFPTVSGKWQEYVIKSYNQGPGNTDKEIAGIHKGYANEYWERFKRNLTKAEA